MCQTTTPKRTAIEREFDLFDQRYPDPITFLKTRYAFHIEITKEKFEERKNPHLKNGSQEVETLKGIYLKHHERADKFAEAIRMLELGGL
jgi:hypothetical protein